jgi:hypothetical protein
VGSLEVHVLPRDHDRPVVGLGHAIREALVNLGRAMLVASTLLSCAEPRAARPAAPAASPCGPEVAGAFDWPVPPGWKKETIPFPLEFAPELPYRGVEELRFMPGFFDPSADGFFSYTFAWWIAGRPRFDAASLTNDLRVYFVGLARAVAEGKFDTEADGFRADIRLVQAEPEDRAGTVAFAGTMRVFDAFKTRKSLDLEAHGRAFGCGDHFVVLLEAAPAPWPDEKRARLKEAARAFKCQTPPRPACPGG